MGGGRIPGHQFPRDAALEVDALPGIAAVAATPASVPGVAGDPEDADRPTAGEADRHAVAAASLHLDQGRPEVLAPGGDDQVGGIEPLGQPQGRTAAVVGQYYHQVGLVAGFPAGALDGAVPVAQVSGFVRGVGIAGTDHSQARAAAFEPREGRDQPLGVPGLVQAADHRSREAPIEAGALRSRSGGGRRGLVPGRVCHLFCDLECSPCPGGGRWRRP
ncbi:hypothetical protein CWI66_09050 [Halomonas sp. 141]|nr:hypothetical protein CWI66_09050 [Halomonas sp. 141]